MKSDRIKNWPEEERPRERLLAEGADKLTEAELLAIILRVGQGTFKKGVLGQNASDFARTLLKDFNGLRGLDRAHVQDLLKVPGLGPAKVAQIKAAFELGKKVCAGKLTAPAFESSQAIADHFRPRFTGKRQEIVIAVFLNGQNRPMGEKDITEGTPTQATVYVRRVISVTNETQKAGAWRSIASRQAPSVRGAAAKTPGPGGRPAVAAMRAARRASGSRSAPPRRSPADRLRPTQGVR